jgi:hypothetical protein
MISNLRRILFNSILVFIAFALSGVLAEIIYSKVVPSSEFLQKFPCKTPPDTLIGGFKHNCKCRWIKEEGIKSFDIEFSTDNFGRRVVYEKTKKSRSDSGQVLFLGGSDVLGKGVDDRFTVANQFLNISDFVTAKNFGGNGIGPQQTVELLQLTDLTQEAPSDDSRNVALFFFGDDHVNRAAGSWPIATAWGQGFPYYVLNSQDQLERKGSFASGNRFSALSLIFKKSRLLDDLLGFASESMAFKDSDIRLTAKMFAVMKERIFSMYKNPSFIVVLSPVTKKSGEKLKIYLKEFGVEYFDYSGLWNPDDPSNWVPEGHPSSKVYKKVAEQLAVDLKKK